MMHSLVLGEATVEYELKRSLRARRLRLTMRTDGKLLVTIPQRAKEDQIVSLIRNHADWILRQRARVLKRTRRMLPALSDKMTASDRRIARERITWYIDHLPSKGRFPVKSIRIKNHKTRWGSCSSRGNLNFNYRIIFLPPELAEYIIVHELCHLLQPNHSVHFWDEVARIVPDHREKRSRLHEYSWDHT